jgi:regulator of sigma D
MKKNLLFERFQKLAGIKSLNENTVSLDEKEFEEFEKQYTNDGEILRNFYESGIKHPKLKSAHEQLHMYLNDGVPDFDIQKGAQGELESSLSKFLRSS